MDSLFSFNRASKEPRAPERPAEPTPIRMPTSLAGDAETVSLPSNMLHSADEALARLYEVFKAAYGTDTLPGGLPSPTFSAHHLTERTLGLGNYRGTVRLAGFAPLALKGGRLEGTVKSQFLADRPADVDAAVERMQQRLLAQKGQLWTAGVLRLTAEETTLSEFLSGLNAWRKTADFRTLYEFQYLDMEGEGLIARIPIHINSDYDESTVVTDEMVRWDSTAAPTLTLRGGPDRIRRVGRLSILAFMPEGWQGSQVTLAATTDDIARERTFPSVREFLASFELAKDGDENAPPATVYLHGDPYVGGLLAFPDAHFPDPILLSGGDDIFQIRYGALAFDDNAVLYLRVLS